MSVKGEHPYGRVDAAKSGQVGRICPVDSASPANRSWGRLSINSEVSIANTSSTNCSIWYLVLIWYRSSIDDTPGQHVAASSLRLYSFGLRLIGLKQTLHKFSMQCFLKNDSNDCICGVTRTCIDCTKKSTTPRLNANEAFYGLLH